MKRACLICTHESPKLVSVWDDPGTGYAFNLYQCDCCGTVTKEDVWNDAGVITLTRENKINRVLKAKGN